MSKWKGYLLIGCMLICILLTGCAKVNFTRVVYEDGSIKDVYEIQFQQDEIKSALLAHSYTEVEAKYYTKRFATKTYEIVNEYNKKINASFSYKLSEAMLAGKITQQEALDYMDKINFETVLDNVNYSFVRYSRIFSTADAFSFYNDLYNTGEDEEDDGYELEDGFFFYKYSICVDNFYTSIIAALKQEDNAFDITYDRLLEEFGREIFSEADLEVTQTYISSEKRLHSNADYTATENGYYLQEWNISTSTPTTIKYYYYIANSTNWYLLCMGIAVAVVGVLAVVVLIRSKKKSNL